MEAPHARKELTDDYRTEQTSRVVESTQTGEKPRSDPWTPVGPVDAKLTSDAIYDLARTEAAEAVVNEVVRIKTKPEPKPKDLDAQASVAGVVAAGVP